MKATNLFISPLKKFSQEPNNFLHSAGMVLPAFGSQKIMHFPPVGSIFFDKLERKISSVLREKEILQFRLPRMQPFKLWKESGRANMFSDKVVYMSGKTIGDKKFIYSPTNEEVITDFVNGASFSHRNFPLEFYQFDMKIRDDGSSRRGLIRTNIFPVLEGYSVNETQRSLDESFMRFNEAFKEILDSLELSYSHLTKRPGYTTFIAESKNGDTKISKCKCTTKIHHIMDDKCRNCGEPYQVHQGIELGCLMAEGSNYADKMDANYISIDGKRKPFFMGTYGLGLTRLLYTIVEQKMGKQGIVWPFEVRPIDVTIIPIRNNQEELEKCAIIQKEISGSRLEVLIDDTQERFVSKLKRADKMGIPNKVIPLAGNRRKAILQYSGETDIKEKTPLEYSALYSNLI